jgi:hypothetical protein
MNEKTRAILNIGEIFVLLGCVRSADWQLYTEISGKQSVPLSGSGRSRSIPGNYQPTKLLTEGGDLSESLVDVPSVCGAIHALTALIGSVTEI